MRLGNALELRILVTARDEERAVEKVRETGAENVETRIDRRRRVYARDRVVDGGPGEIVNREGLGRRIADRVPGEHLAVRKQGHVNPDDGPVDDGAPLSGLPGVARHGGGRLRSPGRQLPRMPVELRLERPAVDDGVLGLMACHGVGVMGQHGPRRAERNRVRQRQDKRCTQD
jgi:hypothetical protein